MDNRFEKEVSYLLSLAERFQYGRSSRALRVALLRLCKRKWEKNNNVRYSISFCRNRKWHCPLGESMVCCRWVGHIRVATLWRLTVILLLTVQLVETLKSDNKTPFIWQFLTLSLIFIHGTLDAHTYWDRYFTVNFNSICLLADVVSST